MIEPSSLSDTSPKAADRPPHPADLLLNLIIALLAPMFLTVSGGDVNVARMAAAETVNAYRAETQADLITVAQIIAFGLAALGSLSLSMVDSLSPAMILRFRTNANACHRSAQQNRLALQQHRSDKAATLPIRSASGDILTEADVVADVAATQKRTAQAMSDLPNTPSSAQPPLQVPVQPSQPTAQAAQAAQAAPPSQPPQLQVQAAQPPAQPATVPPAPATAPPAPVDGDRRQQTIWAAATAQVAAECTADLANLPPEQRRVASMKAAMLSSVAHDLLNGPPIPRINPGDLAAFMRQGTT